MSAPEAFARETTALLKEAEACLSPLTTPELVARLWALALEHQGTDGLLSAMQRCGEEACEDYAQYCAKHGREAGK